MLKEIKAIVKVANKLDLQGHFEHADALDRSSQNLLDLSDSHHDSYMAKPQLAQIQEMAQELYDMIPEGSQLPDWCESKIAVIADKINSVYRKIKYEKDEYSVQD